MAGPFAAFGGLLARPGGRPQAVFGLLGRAPGSMLSIGFVAAASSVGGDAGYVLGGLAAGAYSLAAAFAGPTVGRRADRSGQRRVGRPLALVSAGASLLAVVSLLAMGATPLIVLLAAVAGATQPNVSAFARVRWAAVLHDRDEAATAQALESVIDELTFLIGPALVAILASVWFDGLPIALAAGLLVIGSFGMTSAACLPEPPPHPEPGAGSALRPEFPAGGGLLASVLFLGGALGAAQVLQLAYCREIGHAEGAALVFFVNSGASLIGALVVGGMTFRMPVRHRFTIALVVYAVALLPSAFVNGYWPFVLASVVSGIGIAPTFVQANAVVAEETPARARTAAFALVASAAGLGIALGSAAAGWAVSENGGDQARLLLVPLALGAGITALLADFLHRRSGAAVEPADEIDPEAEAPIVPSPAPPPFLPMHSASLEHGSSANGATPRPRRD